ncbi:MAG: hypothetical protein AAF349_25160 [Cyanobacteria bacterium P01_A01_bin.68]
MNKQQYTNTSPVSSSILNKRYQYAVGLFFQGQNLENALNDLKRSGFPMEQLTVIAKNSYIADVKITALQSYNFAIFDIPNDVANDYKYRVNLGDYLVVLRGTAIFIAAAKNILQRYQIQDFATFSPYVPASNIESKSYQLMTNNA